MRLSPRNAHPIKLYKNQQPAHRGLFLSELAQQHSEHLLNTKQPDKHHLLTYFCFQAITKLDAERQTGNIGGLDSVFGE